MKVLSVFAVVLLLTGCGGGGGSTSAAPPVAPTTAPAATIAGNYSGAITDQIAGAGTVTLTLIQNGTAVAGTWASKFANAGFNNSGAVSGNTNGSQLGVNLTPSDPRACPFAVAAIVNGGSITGTYAVYNCPGVTDGGSVNVTKQ